MTSTGAAGGGGNALPLIIHQTPLPLPPLKQGTGQGATPAPVPPPLTRSNPTIVHGSGKGQGAPVVHNPVQLTPAAATARPAVVGSAIYVLPRPSPYSSTNLLHSHSVTYGPLFRLWLYEYLTAMGYNHISASSSTGISPQSVNVCREVILFGEYFMPGPVNGITGQIALDSTAVPGSANNNNRYIYYQNQLTTDPQYQAQVAIYDVQVATDVHNIITRLQAISTSITYPSDGLDGNHPCALVAIGAANSPVWTTITHPILRRLGEQVDKILALPAGVSLFHYYNMSLMTQVLYHNLGVFVQLIQNPKVVSIDSDPFGFLIALHTYLYAVLDSELMNYDPQSKSKISTIIDQNTSILIRVMRRLISVLLYAQGQPTRLLSELRAQELRSFKSYYPNHQTLQSQSASNMVTTPIEQLPYAADSLTQFFLFAVKALFLDFIERIAVIEKAVVTQVSQVFSDMVHHTLVAVIDHADGDLIYKNNKKGLDEIGRNLWSVSVPMFDDTYLYMVTQPAVSSQAAQVATATLPSSSSSSNGSVTASTVTTSTQPTVTSTITQVPQIVPVTQSSVVTAQQPQSHYHPYSTPFSTQPPPPAGVLSSTQTSTLPLMVGATQTATNYQNALAWLQGVPSRLHSHASPHSSQPPQLGAGSGGGGSYPPPPGQIPVQGGSDGNGGGRIPSGYPGYRPPGDGGGPPSGPPSGPSGSGPPGSGPPGSGGPDGFGNYPSSSSSSSSSNNAVGAGLSLLQSLGLQGNGNHKAKFDPKNLDDLKPYSADQLDPNYNTAESFIEKFEDRMRYYNADDETKIHAFGSKLTGIAKSWYDDLPATKKLNYFDFRDEFWKHCTPDQTRMNSRDAFYKCNQLPHETVRSFYSRLCQLRSAVNKAALVSAPLDIRTNVHQAQYCIDNYRNYYHRTNDNTQKDIYRQQMEQAEQVLKVIQEQVPGQINDTEVRSQFRNHCHHKLSIDIKYKIDSSNSLPIEELLNQVTLAENAYKEKGESTINNDKVTTSKRDNSQVTNTKGQPYNKKGRGGNESSRTPNVVCHQCGKSGHIQRNCPNAKIAALGSITEVEGSATEEGEVEIAREAGISTDVSIPGFLGKRYARALHLDTCANCCVMSKRWWDMFSEEDQRLYGFKPILESSPIRLNLISEGKQVRPYGYASKVPVRLGFWQAPSRILVFIPFYIVDKLNYTALIGWRMWPGVVKTLDVRKQRVILEDGYNPTYVRINPQSTNYSQEEEDKINKQLEKYIEEEMPPKGSSKIRIAQPNFRFGKATLQKRKEEERKLMERSYMDNEPTFSSSSSSSSASTSARDELRARRSSRSAKDLPASSPARSPTTTLSDEALARSERMEEKKEEKVEEEGEEVAEEKKEEATPPPSKTKEKGAGKGKGNGRRRKNKNKGKGEAASSSSGPEPTSSSSSSSSLPSTSSSSSSSDDTNKIGGVLLTTTPDYSIHGFKDYNDFTQYLTDNPGL